MNFSNLKQFKPRCEGKEQKFWKALKKVSPLEDLSTITTGTTQTATALYKPLPAKPTRKQHSLKVHNQSRILI